MLNNFTKLRTRFILGATLLLFMTLLFIGGIISLYFLRNSYSETTRFIKAVDLARESQVLYQNQLYSLFKIIVLEENKFEEYKKNYHSFTYYSDRVQDSLFNLKLMCKDIKEIPGKIIELREYHKSITREYIILITKFVESNFNNKTKLISISNGRSSKALSKMDDIVVKIEKETDLEIQRINNYYFKLTLFSFVLIVLVFTIIGIYLAYKLLTIHNDLEILVDKRTDELAKANEELKIEINKKIKTEKLLILSKQKTDEANTRISISEKKYRMLVENSKDIIFSLDEDWNFITVNKAIKSHLKIDPEKTKSINFINLLNGSIAIRQLIRDKLDVFSREKNPIDFFSQLTSSFASEPKEMHIRLEYINADGKSEIYGIASPITQDVLLNYFVLERQKFEIENFILKVEDITMRITRNINKYMDPDAVSILRIGLREMIINAIEHGNLEISYEDKTNALKNNSYPELIERRRNKPEYSKRKVVIEYQIDPEKAVFTIEDQGKGFNHREILNKEISEVDNTISHGRGIIMSKEIFNEIKYNNKGNKVILKKFY